MHRCYAVFAALKGGAYKGNRIWAHRITEVLLKSVSIKCLWEPSEKGEYMFGRGQTLPKGELVKLLIENRVAFKESANRSITLDPESNLIKA